jgi:hypothetical protein
VPTTRETTRRAAVRASARVKGRACGDPSVRRGADPGFRRANKDSAKVCMKEGGWGERGREYVGVGEGLDPSETFGNHL